VDVLVAEGEGRKDGATGRLSGRAADNRLVHFAVPEVAGAAGPVPRPGDLVTVEVTYAAPHHLVADGRTLALRRTAAGDAWERRQSELSCAPGGADLQGGSESGSTATGAVALGLPTVGASTARVH